MGELAGANEDLHAFIREKFGGQETHGTGGGEAAAPPKPPTDASKTIFKAKKVTPVLTPRTPTNTTFGRSKRKGGRLRSLLVNPKNLQKARLRIQYQHRTHCVFFCLSSCRSS